MRRAHKVWLTREQEDDLQRYARSRTLAARLVERSKMLLLCATGQEIAEQLDVTRQTVCRWLSRFEAQGMKGVEHDAPRSGRPLLTLPAKIAEIVEKTTRQTPEGATHWSTRTLAAQLGVGPTTIRRVWQRNGLRPHQQATFKLSRDPRFEDKLLDVVGLYLKPPEHALVLSCDEKSQIQALNRTQPGLPMKAGRAGTINSSALH